MTFEEEIAKKHYERYADNVSGYEYVDDAIFHALEEYKQKVKDAWEKYKSTLNKTMGTYSITEFEKELELNK